MEQSIAQIEERLEKLPREIHEASMKVISAKKDWRFCKADYEREYSKAIIRKKAESADDEKMPTQTDLVAIARDETYELQLKVYMLEAGYQSAVADRDALDNEFTSLRKIGSMRGISN